MNLFQWVSDLFSSRSPQWRRVENEFIAANPACIVCGNTTRSQLTAHHRIPYHIEPSKELDKSNLRTMCRDDYGFYCHRLVGHFGDYKLYNLEVDAMAAAWRLGREEAKKRRYGNDCGT